MRLLTRSDFDGLACGTILKELGLIEDGVKFVHPKDIQDGIILANGNDVLANIPYVEGAGLWFDHHSSEEIRLGDMKDIPGKREITPSCARIVYEYYGGKKKFPHFEEMIKYVDRVDSGNLTREEVLNPKGWVLLGFIMDPRTGLGRFRNFRIPNYQLMEKLMIDLQTKEISEILKDVDVAERIELYNEQTRLFKAMIEKHTRIEGNVIVTDLRGVEQIYTGNRFYIYSLYPEQNISIWLVDGRKVDGVAMNCSFAVGYSILNRTCKTNVGALMLQYGGGGHHQVGTCQVENTNVDFVLDALVKKMLIDEEA
ncbi:MAG: exopolyphosphatase [Bacillales bacterium]|jgi:nanoRNase/pAp phosphatase (c-di-AMP/oligoRNAs hydrolase)|nr:exopolyphosphatase [Bacillales bacterium]